MAFYFGKTLENLKKMFKLQRNSKILIANISSTTKLQIIMQIINPLNTDLNPTCHLLALLAHPILHISGVRVKDYDTTHLCVCVCACVGGCVSIYVKFSTY